MSEVDETCPTPLDRELTDISDRDLGRFGVGDQVVVRETPTEPTINPRTPPYTIGHRGRIIAVHGVIDNPQDHHLPYPPMYSIRFEGTELFGPSATHAIVAEVHEEWLDPA